MGITISQVVSAPSVEGTLEEEMLAIKVKYEGRPNTRTTRDCLERELEECLFRHTSNEHKVVASPAQTIQGLVWVDYWERGV